jgi:cell wall-associated NlpC family hydrolase
MNYFFDDPDNQRDLKRILDEWLDTPYRHRCGVKGLGTDCIHFVARVLEEVGLLKWRKNLIPNYSRDWHLHNEKSLLMEGFEKEFEGNYEKIGLNALKNGDIPVAFYGKAISHAGFYFDGYIYQAIDNLAVKKININDRIFRRQMRFAYRILK